MSDLIGLEERVRIELKATPIIRKLLIPLNATTAKNCGFAQLMYTDGTQLERIWIWPGAREKFDSTLPGLPTRDTPYKSYLAFSMSGFATRSQVLHA
jgi:hypothetical protein